MILIFLFVFFPVCSFATLPVVDAVAISHLVKEYRQLKAEYDLLQQTYQNAQRQLNQTEAIAHSLEGHYGYGSLFNDVKNLNNRQWSPDNWQDTLQGMSGGNPARYQQLVKQYRENNVTLSDGDYQKGAGNVAVYRQQVQTNQAAFVNASYAFNTIKSHLDRIYQLSQKIEKANNEKSAIDLNTRMQTEMAYVQVQTLKQIALLNLQMARSHTDNIASETQNAQFNQLPEG